MILDIPTLNNGKNLLKLVEMSQSVYKVTQMLLNLKCEFYYMFDLKKALDSIQMMFGLNLKVVGTNISKTMKKINK